MKRTFYFLENGSLFFIFFIFISLPFSSQAQFDNRLKEKASQVVDYVLKGDNLRKPDPIIKAIKILLKEDQIRPMRVDKAYPSFDHQSKDYFDLDMLYNMASEMIPEGDKKTERKLRRLRPAIDKRMASYKKLDFDHFNGIEFKVFTVEPEGEIPIFFPFSKGDVVSLFIEIAEHFSVEVYDINDIMIKEGLLEDEKEGLYGLKVLVSGDYKFNITNLQKDEVSCRIYKHVN